MEDKACSVTGKVGCAERDCELHYMDAPLKLAPVVICETCGGTLVARWDGREWLHADDAPLSMRRHEVRPVPAP
jgi:hypothetical protein